MGLYCTENNGRMFNSGCFALFVLEHGPAIEE